MHLCVSIECVILLLRFMCNCVNQFSLIDSDRLKRAFVETNMRIREVEDKRINDIFRDKVSLPRVKIKYSSVAFLPNRY